MPYSYISQLPCLSPQKDLAAAYDPLSANRHYATVSSAKFVDLCPSFSPSSWSCRKATQTFSLFSHSCSAHSRTDRVCLVRATNACCRRAADSVRFSSSRALVRPVPSSRTWPLRMRWRLLQTESYYGEKKETKLWVIMNDRRVQVEVIYLVSCFLFLPFMFYFVFVCFFSVCLCNCKSPQLFFFFSFHCCWCFDSFRQQRLLHYCMHRELISRTFMMLTNFAVLMYELFTSQFNWNQFQHSTAEPTER